MRTSLRVLAANMRASVVAICGTRGSGKDSVAAILSQEAGFVNHKLARPLKDAMRGLFSLDAAHVDGELKDVVHPAWGVTPRVLMQWFGTEVMQHELVKVVPSVGRRFWADRLVDSLTQEDAKAVVTDMRFQHELDALREAFGDRLVAIRVERFRRSGDVDSHESETASATLAVDLVVQNDGTLDRLGDFARDALCFGSLYDHSCEKARACRLLSARDGMLIVADEDGGDVRRFSVEEWRRDYALRPQCVL